MHFDGDHVFPRHQETGDFQNGSGPVRREIGGLRNRAAMSVDIGRKRGVRRDFQKDTAVFFSCPLKLLAENSVKILPLFRGTDPDA